MGHFESRFTRILEGSRVITPFHELKLKNGPNGEN